MTADAMLREAAGQFLELSAVGACSSPFDHVACSTPKGGKVRPSMGCALQLKCGTIRRVAKLSGTTRNI